MSNKSVMLFARAPKEMAEKLKKLAKKDDRPLSGYIRRVLALHIEAEENNG